MQDPLISFVGWTDLAPLPPVPACPPGLAARLAGPLANAARFASWADNPTLSGRDRVTLARLAERSRNRARSLASAWARGA